MSAQLDEAVVVDVDLTLEPQCESQYHLLERPHADGPATHVLAPGLCGAMAVGAGSSSAKTFGSFPSKGHLMPVVDEEVTVDVDLTLEPRCGHSYHDIDLDEHDGPGTHWMRGPCGHGGVRCARWAVTCMEYRFVSCFACGVPIDPHDITFTLI